LVLKPENGAEDPDATEDPFAPSCPTGGEPGTSGPMKNAAEFPTRAIPMLGCTLSAPRFRVFPAGPRATGVGEGLDIV
jgi:hypothetical protein